MAHLFCVICRDVIPVQPEHPETQRPRADTDECLQVVPEPEDFMISTTCGHIFHNNCLQAWFKTEMSNTIRNLAEQIFIVRENENGDVISAGRVFCQSCPFCKDTIYARDCTRLYPMEAPVEPTTPPAVVELKRVVQDFGELLTDFNELRDKYEQTVKDHGIETENFKSQLNEMTKNLEDAIKEHNEIEEKWIQAMRVLDSKRQETKQFYIGILETVGFCIPSMHSPDLSAVNLIGQVIENREIVPDEPAEVTLVPATKNIRKTPSAAPVSACPRPKLGYVGDASLHKENVNENTQLKGSAKMAVKVGDKVVWSREVNNPMIGIIKWIGKKQHVWTAGIEFERPIGKHARLALKLRDLFVCKPGHGRLVPIVELERYDELFLNSTQPMAQTTLNDLRDLKVPPIRNHRPYPDTVCTNNGLPQKSKKFNRIPTFVRRFLPNVRAN